MMTAADHRDDQPVSDEVAALQAIAAAYKADNARLAARVAELERGHSEHGSESPGDDRLQPLKALVQTDAEYEQARRARRSGLLHAVRRGGRWFATAKAIREWRAGR